MNFWDLHGIFWGIIFCLSMAWFPRITMVITGICFRTFFGPLAWIGWLLVPRLTVAIFASMFYFSTNPLLCIGVWLWCLNGGDDNKKDEV